ncbi:V0D/AC39 family V-type ATPase subunit [Peptoanaerobacter stomatis]|jgi:ATP synthase, subunit C
MSNNEHIYAVARIRAKEVNLLDSSVIEQLISSNSVESMNRILVDKGWGDGSEKLDNILSVESDKIWSLMREMFEDMSIFDTLRVEKDFHNLKAAIKSEYTKVNDSSIYLKNGSISVDEIIDAVKNKNFANLPEQIANYPLEAYEIMFKTGDGQLCDMILDKGCLEYIIELSKESKNLLLTEYAQMKVVIADIKIAIRGAKTGKDRKFFDMALVSCDKIDINVLADMAVQGVENIYSYLETTDFKEAVDAIKTDFAVFECWCDNQIISAIRKEKYTPMTISPIIAYILARENEIKTVRILTVAKRNDLKQEEVKKRMRDMYV